MALRAVVLPAPLGPMIPRMRPSSTRRSTPSSAIVEPKLLRNPRASMHAMASTLLLLWRIRLGGFCRRVVDRWILGCGGCAIQELARRKAEPLNGCAHPRPLFSQELLPFCLQQQTARAGIDEHAQAALGLHQTFVHQLLIALEDRKWIHPIFSRDIAHGRQRVALLENTIQNHRDHTVPKLAVDRLTVIPLTVH